MTINMPQCIWLRNMILLLLCFLSYVFLHGMHPLAQVVHLLDGVHDMLLLNM